MKRILAIIFFALFLASVLFFQIWGWWVRDLLSPKVVWDYPGVDEVTWMFLTLPESAVYEDEMGRTYVYLLVDSEKYPEQAYEADQVFISIRDRQDGLVYFYMDQVDTTDAVIFSADKPLEDGARVVPVE